MGKRPGYKPQQTIFRLKFEGDQYEGLEVEAKSLPLGDFFRFQELQLKAGNDVESAKEVVKRLSDVIVGWNLEDENDQPIPVTFEGIASLEMGFVLNILNAWVQAVASVPNLSKTLSNGGGTYPEQSIPMEVSSQSPSN